MSSLNSVPNGEITLPIQEGTQHTHPLRSPLPHLIDVTDFKAHAVSFYLVRWVGLSSVIGQNKLTCDWPDWLVAQCPEKGRSVDLLDVSVRS